MTADTDKILALGDQDRKDFAVKLLGSLDESDKSAVATSAGLKPSDGITNIIWMVLIIALAFILIASVASLIYGVIFLQRSADSVQVVVTVFTAVMGFITGLLTPGPSQKSKS